MANSLFWAGFGLVAALFALLGLLFLLLAAWVFVLRWRLILFGERAFATVVDLRPGSQIPGPEGPLPESPETPSFFPLLEFTDSAGTTHQVKSDTSASPDKFPVGEFVPVLYREGDPKSMVVNYFWMKWSVPVLLFVVGLALMVPATVAVAHAWPPLKVWAAAQFKQVQPVLIPTLAIGLPAAFTLLGIYATFDRMGRVNTDVRIEGIVEETGMTRVGRGRCHWARIRYQDGEGNEYTRVLPLVTRAHSRETGQPIALLIVPVRPHSVLINEPGELWLLPFLMVALGSVCLVAFTWAWTTGRLV